MSNNESTNFLRKHMAIALFDLTDWSKENIERLNSIAPKQRNGKVMLNKQPSLDWLVKYFGLTGCKAND